ncbi:MAG: hypothetical protein AAGA60_29530 [Cyanobacteria bacterium P01_E01_bin.42]
MLFDGVDLGVLAIARTFFGNFPQMQAFLAGIVSSIEGAIALPFPTTRDRLFPSPPKPPIIQSC